MKRDIRGHAAVMAVVFLFSGIGAATDCPVGTAMGDQKAAFWTESPRG